MTLAERLLTLRKANHLTKVQLSAKTGIDRYILLEYEQGRFYPTLPNCQRLADIYGLTLAELLRDIRIDLD